MKINRPIKSSNKFLLGWFVFFSALAHLLFISLADNGAEPEAVTVSFSTPLQITVISSRPTAKTSPQVTLQKTGSVKKAVPLPLPVKTVKDSSSTNKPLVHIVKTSNLAEKKPEIIPEDNSETKRITETPSATSTTETISVKDAPLNYLRQQLKQAIKARFTYPRIARRMGWEGLVGISLRIEDDGSLNRVQVAHSSGHKVLDENARKTIQSIGRIQVVSNLAIQASDTEIEVLYRLTD